jgi:hypothetical protein
MLAAIVVGGPTPDAAANSSDDVTNSLTVFPSEIDVTAQRGQRIERSIGIVQTGAAERQVTFEIEGDAAQFITIQRPDDGDTIDGFVANESEPAFVEVVIAPSAPVPDGLALASIRVVAEGGDVAVGSQLEIRVDVGGDLELNASLTGVRSAAVVEVGQPIRLSLDVDVTGNANLNPEVVLEVDSPDGARTVLESYPPAVEPGGARTIQSSWSTRGWTVGEYRGEVVLAADGVEVGRSDIAVDLVPAGSRGRALTVVAADLVSEARPGGIAKIVTRVRNDSSVAGRAVFAGDLWFDTSPIAPLRSDPVVIEPGAVAELIVYATLIDAGEYRVRGRANMDGVESSTFAVVFVATPEPGVNWAIVLIWGAIGGGVVMFLAVLMQQRRHRGVRT